MHMANKKLIGSWLVTFMVHAYKLFPTIKGFDPYQSHIIKFEERWYER